MDTSLIVSLVLLGILGFWAVGAYTRLTALRGAIGAAWRQFDEPLRRRHELLPPVLSRLRDSMPQELPALDALIAPSEQVLQGADALRQRPGDAEAAARLRSDEQRLDAALVRLRSLLDLHPEAASEEPVAQALTELGRLDERLRFRRQLFNQAVARYNEAIAQFPTSLLAPMFRFAPAGGL